MGDIWRAQISCDAPVIAGQDTDPAGFNFPVLASRIFTATDSTGILYALQCQLNTHTTAGGVFEYQTLYLAQRQGAGGAFTNLLDVAWFGDAFSRGGIQINQILTPFNDPFQTILQIEEADGQDGGSFLAGGTLAIEKDFEHNMLTFITPLGNMVIPLNGYFPADNGPLMASGMGHALMWGTDINSSETTTWFNFQTYKNGVLFAGAALSAADPGIWGPWIDEEFTVGTTYNFLGPEIPTNDAQQTTRYKTEFIHTAAAPDGSGSSEIRLGTATPPVQPIALDLTEQPEHNLTWGAWAPPEMMFQTLQARRSDRDGASWQPFTVVSGSDVLTSPSIQVFASVVYVLYYDNGPNLILLSLSHDAGLTWSAPMPVPITGTNPRLVIDRNGSQYYFSFSGGSIFLQRSFNGGASLFDAVPIVVATAVPAQDFGATMAADGTLLVAYSDAGMNWITRKSADMGLSWSTA